MNKDWQKQENLMLVKCIIDAITNNKEIDCGIKDFAIKFKVKEKEVLKHWESISDKYQLVIEKATNQKIEILQKTEKNDQKQELTIDSIIDFLQNNKKQIDASYVNDLEQKYQELKIKYDTLYEENEILNRTLTDIKKTLK
ncbi:hypothetical protein D3C87_79880 [compost metagenome]